MERLTACAVVALAAASPFALAARPAAEPARGQATIAERGAPSNGADNCADAPILSGLGAFDFDNTFATTDGQPHTLCAKDGGPQIARDLWWRWTSPVTGPVTISTCGLTGVDTEIAIYAPNAVCSPGDEALIFCDDQNCNNQTEITFLAFAGNEYLIRIGSFDGGNGFPAADGGVGQFSVAGQLSPCGPAVCQDYNLSVQDGLNSDTFQRVADNFTAPVDSLLTFICVEGDYNSGSATPGADDFTVVYYADNNGVPGALIAAFSSVGTEGPVPTGLFVFGTLPQFAHKLTHPPVPVAAGQQVWVEVRNLASDWFWSIGSGGDSRAMLDFNGAYDASDAVNFDLTFCVGPFDTCPTDVNNDGSTNFGDLNAVISNFNTVCP